MTTLLMTPSVPFGATALTGSGTLTKLLNCTQVASVTAISNALEWAISDYV